MNDDDLSDGVPTYIEPEEATGWPILLDDQRFNPKNRESREGGLSAVEVENLERTLG